MKKEIYEWVMIMSKGDDLILTESQYEFYKKNINDGIIFFKTNAINPSFVVSASKRKPQTLFKLYPCLTCNTNGILLKTRKDDGTYDTCTNCEGTGIDTKQEPHLDLLESEGNY